MFYKSLVKILHIAIVYIFIITLNVTKLGFNIFIQLRLQKKRQTEIKKKQDE